MKAAKFFSAQAGPSGVKARIVSKYFLTWANIIATQNVISKERIAYFDLFSGPGRYKDGNASTPLMVLTDALKNPRLRDSLVAVFNDEDDEHTSTLQKEIDRLPSIDQLKHKPSVLKATIDQSVADHFRSRRLIPAFFFIDPFGYKGLTASLIRAVIKDPASECVFFFNYSRITGGINNPRVRNHMEALFGRENLADLKERIKKPFAQREKLILEHLAKSMKDAGAKHVMSFRFVKGKKRVTHHLVFVTKHPLGYEKKDIMAKESTRSNQGVPLYEYAPRTAYFGDLFHTALDELEDELTVFFKGRRITMVEVYHQHNLDRPYVANNYKKALDNLERAGRITCSKPQRRANTFADDIRCIFPAVPIERK